jgi:hypothetical protein
MSQLLAVVGFDTGYIASTPAGTAEAHGAILGYEEHQLRQQAGAFLRQIQTSEVRRYVNRASTEDEIWSERRRAELAVFADNPDRSIRHMLVRASWQNGVLVGFTLERRSRGRGFSARDAALLDARRRWFTWPMYVCRQRAGAEPLDRWRADFRAVGTGGGDRQPVMKGYTNKEIASNWASPPSPPATCCTRSSRWWGGTAKRAGLRAASCGKRRPTQTRRRKTTGNVRRGGPVRPPRPGGDTQRDPRDRPPASGVVFARARGRRRPCPPGSGQGVVPAGVQVEAVGIQPLLGSDGLSERILAGSGA